MALNKRLMFSSVTDEWETPGKFFDRLDSMFEFTLDVCADEKNRKCASYLSKDEDGLSRPWSKRNWMNPPYGRTLPRWVEKADREARVNGCMTVALLPARTDTRWFSQHCSAWHVVWIRGRIRFGGGAYSAPFPSMLVFFGIPALSMEANG